MPGKFFLYDYKVGDTVITRKKHPCGSNAWELTRVGIEFRMKCKGCGRTLVMERPALEKATVEVIPGSDDLG
ncbi:MAG: DUF951 domain-containing protein [Clostridiales bacterium]|nr:DUF951 domain-containing protein [Clostridiales bacterium]